MKKRICDLLLLCLVLSMAACAKAPTWQEQYDLGVRYLSEGNYQEAIIAFTAAIEIDPKQENAYIGLADAYIGAGDTEKAVEVLEKAVEAIGETDKLTDTISALLSSVEEPFGVRTVREDYEDGTYRISEWSDGKLTRDTFYNANGTVDSYWVYEFDDAGRQIRGTRYNADDTVDKTLVENYDASGKKTGYTYFHSDGRVEEWEQNETGQVERCTIYDSDGRRVEVTELDTNENPTKTTYYNSDGSVQSVTTY